MVSSLLGIPIYYDLVPANSDERLAAEEVIDHFAYCDLLADKGFIVLSWQTKIFDRTGNLVWTPNRVNQKLQNEPRLMRFLSRKRERIEGVFYEIQDVGRNIEHLLVKTVLGLATRVIAKIASHTLRHLLWYDFGVYAQSFQVLSV
jgi:hypothetical protein